MYGLTNVQCYNCQYFEHFASTYMIRSRMTSNFVGERGWKRQSCLQGQRTGIPTGLRRMSTGGIGGRNGYVGINGPLGTTTQW